MPLASTCKSASDLRADLAQLDSTQAAYATRFVEALLATAKAIGASDVHLQPVSSRHPPNAVRRNPDSVLLASDSLGDEKTADGARSVPATLLDVRWRLDGVLQEVGVFPRGEAADVVTRLKVLAELLTYKTDVPQEGRIRQSAGDIETRVSTFPTGRRLESRWKIWSSGGGVTKGGRFDT